ETQRDVGDDVPLGVCAQDGDVLEVDLAPHWDVEAVDPTDELVLEELGAEDCAAADPEAELRALGSGGCGHGDRAQHEDHGDAVLHGALLSGRVLGPDGSRTRPLPGPGAAGAPLLLRRARLSNGASCKPGTHLARPVRARTRAEGSRLPATRRRARPDDRSSDR